MSVRNLRLTIDTIVERNALAENNCEMCDVRVWHAGLCQSCDAEIGELIANAPALSPEEESYVLMYGDYHRLVR